MKYQGGKSRHAKQILAAIQKHLSADLSKMDFYEPFCGGANMSVYASRQFRRVFASDINRFMVILFQEYQSGWKPPRVLSEAEYKKAKETANQKNPSNREAAFCAFVGTACSYGAKWFGGYARGGGRNYAAEGGRWLSEFKTELRSIDFDWCGYEMTRPTKNAVLYLDPPYAGTTGYKIPFDSAAFWAWAEKQAAKGVHVFVSEYSAPARWVSIWGKPVNSSLTKNTGAKKAIEKLFTFNGK